jgi:hypothetical protein
MCACVLVLAAWAAGAALAKTAAHAEPNHHWRRLSAEVEVGFVGMETPLKKHHLVSSEHRRLELDQFLAQRINKVSLAIS